MIFDGKNELAVVVLDFAIANRSLHINGILAQDVRELLCLGWLFCWLLNRLFGWFFRWLLDRLSSDGQRRSAILLELNLVALECQIDAVWLLVCITDDFRIDLSSKNRIVERIVGLQLNRNRRISGRLHREGTAIVDQFDHIWLTRNRVLAKDGLLTLAKFLCRSRGWSRRWGWLWSGRLCLCRSLWLGITLLRLGSWLVGFGLCSSWQCGQCGESDDGK